MATSADLLSTQVSTTSVMMTVGGATSSNSEFMLTFSQCKALGAPTSASSFVVPAGKRFRIQTLVLSHVGNLTATPAQTTYRLRVNSAGAVTTGAGNIVASFAVSTNSNANAFGNITVPFADGFDIPGDGTLQFGMSAICVYNTNGPLLYANIIGFEF